MLGTELTDAWDIKGIQDRNQAKVIMRTIYGSSASCEDMWKAKHIKFTAEDVAAYNQALVNGEIAVGDRFSKFIINNVKPQETMQVKIGKDKFTIECNRYRNIGETTKIYDLWDTHSESIPRIHHTDTVKVPDLDQFRRYFVTLLIFC